MKFNLDFFLLLVIYEIEKKIYDKNTQQLLFKLFLKAFCKKLKKKKIFLFSIFSFTNRRSLNFRLCPF